MDRRGLAHNNGRKSAPRRIRRFYRAFVPYLKPYGWQSLLAALALLGTVGMGLLRPWPLKLIIDNVLLDKPMPAMLAGLPEFAGSKQALLFVLASAIVVVVFLESVFAYFNRYLLAAVGHRVANDVRQAAFVHLQRLSLGDQAGAGTGDLVVRLTSDIKALRDLLVGYVQKFATHVLTFAGTVAVMLWMDWRLTLPALLVVLPMYLSTRRFSERIQSASRRKRRKEGEVASLVQETLAARPVVQAFTREEHETRRFAQRARESLEAALQSVRLGGFFSRFVQLLTAVGMAIVAGYGASRVLAGEATPGDLVVFTAYVADLYKPVQNLAELAVEFIDSLVSGERILDLVETDIALKDAPHAREARRLHGQVRFESVNFGYIRAHPVLRDVSFEVEPGQTVALVGPSGAGKSTIINLLVRFFDPWQGRVLIDGQDIRGFRLKSLRRQISLVSQQALLFRRTVRENIAYGRPGAPMHDIVEAARAAQAHGFIERLPHGYDTVLGERGETLSGGQAQRMALARAFLKNAPILLLDEPTASVDSATESHLDEALRELRRERTTFIIAHRLSTVQSADLILVLVEGRIVDQGTHDELMARSEMYRDLYELQFRHPVRSRRV